MTETELRTDGDTRCAETHEPMTWNEAAGAYTHAGKCVFGREHRHLELTVYPPPAPLGIRVSRLEWDAWHNARALEKEARIAKTLPEACLSAEYWKAVWEYDTRFPEDTPGWHWHHNENDSEVVIEHEVLLRFAKRPHAMSSDYQ